MVLIIVVFLSLKIFLLRFCSHFIFALLATEPPFLATVLFSF